jgi:hypothetical protein
MKRSAQGYFKPATAASHLSDPTLLGNHTGQKRDNLQGHDSCGDIDVEAS